jgi:hypothetical protein
MPAKRGCSELRLLPLVVANDLAATYLPRYAAIMLLDIFQDLYQHSCGGASVLFTAVAAIAIRTFLHPFLRAHVHPR